MSAIFFYKEFNGHDLGKGESPLRKKFNTIIKDLKENKLTHQGNIKLISSKGGIKYLRAKLSDEGRLLFTNTKHNNKDVFVILEVIPNHDYENSRFLKSTDKIKSIEIKETEEEATEKSSDIVEIKDLERAHWLGKLVTFSATQEDIVKRAEESRLPLIVSGAAGSGKTSVALESLKKIQEKFGGGKILYITKSKNLIKESKKLFDCDEATDKLGTHTPEEIDFLSIHEFFKKIIKKDVEGKKPIDRSKFFSWFNEICNRDKFKEYKKDGDKIFEEFTAVIGGGGLLGEDGKDRYAKLGNRQSMFPPEKRNSIYDFFMEYRKFIEKDSEYYDPNLIAHECTEEKIYDAVVVDEVQDLTSSTLNLILRSLKSESKGNFLLCGDVNQVVHPSFFSLSKLKSFLSQNEYVRNQGSEVFYTLEKNYRNSEQVIELANRILHLKNYCFASEDKMTADEAFFMKSDTENTGNVSFIADDKKEEIAKKVSQSINWAVLVLDDEKKEEARKLFSTPLVFNIHEAKGLEFENVILYKFMSCKAYNGIWNIVCPKKTKGEIDNAISEVRGSYEGVSVNTSRNKNKEDKSFEEYKFYMNALYVGASRAIDSVYILDNAKKHDLLQVIKPERIGNVDIKKEESSPEAWKNKALELVDKGNIEQAKEIAAKLRLEGKKEYAAEITNALKAKGYHSEQAISELKTEPQKSSTMVSNEKREQSPSKKKELTKKELGENTNRLFLALKNGKLQLAEKLIEQGINVNATTKEEGDTPLHEAAYNGHERVAQLLLEHGANANATSKDGDTPLHLAADKGYKGVVQLLLEKKADINATDKGRATPLLIAAYNGHEGVVQLLLEYKAKIDDSNNNGYTPLHIAAQRHLDNIVQLLLKHGANVDTTTKEGYTPLHVAAQKAHNKRVVQLLLERGAGVNVKDNKDYTPLHDAAQSGSKDVVQLLLNHEADINALTKDPVTPLLLALQYFHSEVVDLLLADSNINVGHISYIPISEKDRRNYQKNKKDYGKCDTKREQDTNLFEKVKEAANEKDTSKQDKLLKEIEKLLKPENKYGFKPSLNYSPGVGGETTLKIAIKAGGKILQLLYDHAEKNIGKDTEIFKQLKIAKEHENTQPKSDVSNVSVSGHLIQAQGFKLGGA